MGSVGVAFWRLRGGAVGVEVLTCGADSSAVQGKPRNALRLQAAKASWAAVLCNGSVVNWGDPDYGGGTHRTLALVQTSAIYIYIC